MSYKFSCPTCGQHYSASPSRAGTQIQCATCKTDMIIPPPPMDIRPIGAAPPNATIMKAPPGHTWDTHIPKKRPPVGGNGLKIKPSSESAE